MSAAEGLRVVADGDDQGPLIAPIEPLLVDVAAVAAMLGIGRGSVENLESRDPHFPRPVAWPLTSKRWRREDIVEYATTRGTRTR